MLDKGSLTSRRTFSVLRLRSPIKHSKLPRQEASVKMAALSCKRAEVAS
jgi:hypothetical protein